MHILCFLWPTPAFKSLFLLGDSLPVLAASLPCSSPSSRPSVVLSWLLDSIAELSALNLRAISLPSEKHSSNWHLNDKWQSTCSCLLNLPTQGLQMEVPWLPHTDRETGKGGSPGGSCEWGHLEPRFGLHYAAAPTSRCSPRDQELWSLLSLHISSVM